MTTVEGALASEGAKIESVVESVVDKVVASTEPLDVPIDAYAETPLSQMIPEVAAFIVDRLRMLKIRQSMIDTELLTLRDDLDIDSLKPVKPDTKQGRGAPIITNVGYLPKPPLPNAVEGTVTPRVMDARQYFDIFRCSWDMLFPQRPNQARGPHAPNGRGGTGSMPGGHMTAGDIKWDQPENINNNTSLMSGGQGIFNLGDIRSAKAPLNPEFSVPLNVREMEGQMAAAAAQGTAMPSYPQHQSHMGYYNAYQQHAYSQNPGQQTEQSNRIKAAIGLVDGQTPDNAATAARLQQQRQSALDHLQNLQQSVPGASAQNRHTTQRQVMSPEDRKKYEYYQQRLPHLKCVSVESLPDYIAMNPQIHNQIQIIEHEVREIQARQASFQAYQMNQVAAQQHAMQMQMQQQGGEQGNAEAQQQWYRQQQHLYQQQMAQQQQMRQQQQQGGVAAGAQQGHPGYMQQMTQQQQQMTPQQQQYYYQLQYQQQQQYYQQQQQQQQRQQQGSESGPAAASQGRPTGDARHP